MVIVYNKKNCCHSIAGICFVPGLNELSDTSYDMIKEHDCFKELVDNKFFKVTTSSKVEELKEEIATEIDARKKEEIVKTLKVNKPIDNLDATQIKRKKEVK